MSRSTTSATEQAAASSRHTVEAAFIALTTILWASSVGATPVSSTHTVSSITTPGSAAGDVLAIGGAIFAGSGGFGSQSIVRIDGGGTTVLAEGFSSLGGFDYDAANDRLVVGDNFYDGTTGDTLYEVPNPFGTPASPAAALGLELLGPLNVPGYADVVLDPTDPTGDTLFVSDASASFPPLGILLQVVLSTQSVTTIQTGLDFSAGLATDGTSLFFGNSLLGGGGDLLSVPLTSPTDTPNLIGNYPGGLFDLEFAPDGSLLATSGDSLLRIDPLTGTSTVIANGFGFAAGLFADDDGTIYAIDGFPTAGEENQIWVFTPVPEPGSGLLLAGGILALACRRDQRSRNRNCTGTVTRP